MKEKSTKAIILKNIFLSIISPIIILLILELMLRGLCFINLMELPREKTTSDYWAEDGWAVDKDLNWTLIPNNESLRGGANCKTNSYGLRDQEIPLEKPLGTYRIIVLGDSTVLGFGVPFEKTFSEILEFMLNKNQDAINFDVINAGVPGYSIFNSYTYLKRDGMLFDPDLIIVQTNFNDRRYIVSTEFEDGPDFYDRFYYRLRTRELLDNSYLARRMRSIIERTFGFIQSDFDLLNYNQFHYKRINMEELQCRVEPERYKMLMSELIDLSRTHDIPVILIPLKDRPTKYIRKYYSAKVLAEAGLYEEAMSNLFELLNTYNEPSHIPVYQIIVAKKINELGIKGIKIKEVETIPWMSNDGNIPIYLSDPYIEIMQEMAEEEDVFFVNFDPSSEMYIDYIHLNSSGHKKLARKLFIMLKASKSLNISIDKQKKYIQ